MEIVVAALESLVLEHLRALCAEAADVKAEGHETRQRVGHLEHQMAGIYGQYASVSERLDRIFAMLENINRRLEISEAP